MPHYDIRIRGKGIDLPSDGDPIVGLLAHRKVRAPSAAEALEKVKLALTMEWRDGHFQRRNRGSAPHFEVESLTRLPWWKAPFARAPKRGFDFYSLERETSGAVAEAA